MGGICLTATMTHHLPLPQTQISTKASLTSSPLLLSSLPSPSRRNFLSLLVLVPTVVTNFQTSSPCVAADEFDPVSQADKDLSVSASQRVASALALLEKGRELQARGDFIGALDYFTRVIKDYKDFAFSDYARVGRALALYETGDREEAIAEMEDVSISLKGYPEIHAALAAALYVDKKAPLLAENQFTIATLLDPHYTDIAYVKDTKHWPPSLHEIKKVV